MPRGDKTGPQGEGPMTGREMGHCAKNNAQGNINQCQKRGFGNGRGFGFCQNKMGNGLRNKCWQTNQDLELNKEEESAILRNQLILIESKKESIQKRIKEINEIK